MNSEFSLEAQMMRLKLSYIGHISPSSLEKKESGRKEKRTDSSKTDELNYSSNGYTIGKHEGPSWGQNIMEKVYVVIR